MSIYAEIAPEVCKLTPPVAVTNAVLLGVTLNDWVTILTLIYLGMLILTHAFKQLKKYKRVTKSSVRKVSGLEARVKNHVDSE